MPERTIVTEDELAAMINRELREVAECEDISVALPIPRLAPDKEGCNWDPEFIGLIGGSRGDMAACGGQAQHVARRLAKTYNIAERSR